MIKSALRLHTVWKWLHSKCVRHLIKLDRTKAKIFYNWYENVAQWNMSETFVWNICLIFAKQKHCIQNAFKLYGLGLVGHNMLYKIKLQCALLPSAQQSSNLLRKNLFLQNFIQRMKFKKFMKMATSSKTRVFQIICNFFDVKVTLEYFE